MIDIGQLFHNLLFDYTVRTVALGAAILGIVSGTLGAFAVLRRQSLLGDAISHAALPGIVIAFLLTRSREPAIFLFGALVAGWIATLSIAAITRTTRIKDDAALGLVLSVFFGFGLMLLTFAQKLSDARQAGLDKFLFGQAATLLQNDVIAMAAVGALALGATLLFWKEFKLLTFDADYAASLGYPVQMLDVLLTTLLVVAIVIGLQTVGVVLIVMLHRDDSQSSQLPVSSRGIDFRIFHSASFRSSSERIGSSSRRGGAEGRSSGGVGVTRAALISPSSLRRTLDTAPPSPST